MMLWLSCEMDVATAPDLKAVALDVADADVVRVLVRSMTAIFRMSSSTLDLSA